MILVDTSVWIDFFAGRQLPHVALLEQYIIDDQDLAVCGIVLTEILQGIPDDSSYRRVREYFSPLVMLPMPEDVFIRAADIYRALRKKGITVRKSNDCIVAATALEYQCDLLHNDKDFTAISRYCSLRIVFHTN